MPDYTAVFLPGLTMTFTAASNLAGGDPVEVAGSGLVQRASAATPRYVGMAGHDVQAGLRVTVIAARPVFDSSADGAITAGDQLAASAVAGRAVRTVPPAGTATAADIAAARAVIGLALTTAADGATVRWMQF